MYIADDIYNDYISVVAFQVLSGIQVQGKLK